ncbi:protoporphyrinogen oxidase [Apiospora marii]|uniref:protoporphyrinogen oxidase n=1 Tax=Apiospora marii TaxID=335849 RepID=A0ABR1S8Z0_9PEZI
MTPKRPEELFIALLRSAYGNGCRDAVLKGRPTRALPPLTLLRAQTPSARGFATGRPRLPYVPKALFTRSSRAYATAASPQPKATADVESPPPSADPPRRIAVLGGGITGLTAAHYLARHAKNVHITLYEGSDHLGGWIKGEVAQTADGDEILLQQGPRMLRSGASGNKYDDLILYDVLANLELGDKIVYPKGAANSRYIYYPDHLVKLPAEDMSLNNIIESVRSFLTEPIWEGSVDAGLHWWNHSIRMTNKRDQRKLEIRTAMMRNETLPPLDANLFEKDESVADYLLRIMGEDRLIKNVVSGMLHGIYGGDTYKLSAKHTIFDRFWYSDQALSSKKDMWMAVKDIFLPYDILDGPDAYHVIDMAERGIKHKLIAFEDGLLTLARGLENDLKEWANVEIKRNTPVTSLAHQDGKVLVSAEGHTEQFDQVLSTLYAGQLAKIAQPANSLPSLSEVPAVTIMVVNMWYPNEDLLAANPGFGYLIPQGVSEEQNPERALGVLFDSDIQTRKEQAGTKLTVMMGGHQWDKWSFLPDEKLAVEMAKNVVHRHLGISPDEKGLVATARLCRDCLPQHTVGHRDRLRKAHYELASAFQGQLMVAGPSYTTVGVIPSMRAGYDAAMRIARGQGAPHFRKKEKGAGVWNWYYETLDKMTITPSIPDHVGATGLEWATESDGRNMVPVPRVSMWFKSWTPESGLFIDEEGNIKPGRLDPLSMKDGIKTSDLMGKKIR